jgi:hypothetical protein
MPAYRIHHLKDHLRQPFRFTAHTAGVANVKPRDYNPGGSVDAKSPYSAYFELRGTETPIQPGDLLESEGGDLRIFKFIGFEEARWVVPDPKREDSGVPADIPAVVE